MSAYAIVLPRLSEGKNPEDSHSQEEIEDKEGQVIATWSDFEWWTRSMGVPSPFLAACFEIVLAERAAQAEGQR